MQELKESMVSDREVAHAAEGKSVRACDNCVRKRARWYCAADDAFLCDTCDFSVHSANPLARRHERVRLKIASSSKENEISLSMDDDWRAGARPPSWHEGFTQKARTPRRQKRRGKLSSIIPMHLVPEQEVCSEEESEEQLLYRVPVFDLFEVENYGENSLRFGKSESDEFRRENNEFQGIVLPSKPDLAEFAADVESLLGKGLDDEAFDMEGMRIFHCDDGDDDVEGGAKECSLRIKAEDEEINRETTATDEGNLLRIDLGRETFELNFDYASPITCEEDNKVRILEKDDSSKALLKLDYDRVMSAWDHKKSPWMSGERPELLGTSGTTHAYGEMAVTSGQAAGGDGRRKARVSRYREKRRTRLFSKKIRYEVRKLNAEKRPRMKGRFMKRTSFAASAFPLLNK